MNKTSINSISSQLQNQPKVQKKKSNQSKIVQTKMCEQEFKIKYLVNKFQKSLSNNFKKRQSFKKYAKLLKSSFILLESNNLTKVLIRFYFQKDLF